ncbi:allophanate hydrolase subunit 1 [Pseudomonas sp. M47T1]|uniref:5-oxoprolinase subunit PxpB n=1 Tax=Pseudomonas sp. M47T1 TaxID=1179778 RepID=UPI00026075E4|nr:5-oxoprolinase subunit PxpB [Pseudomonas sp. M47T1]EIK94815.1 allophanate hydrolase subunit 1 [Pseudomonas sp. M47T1]
MKVGVEVAGIDCLTLRLFDVIDEANVPWLLAAAQRLRATFGAALVELVPSYTTLMLQYNLAQLDDAQARALCHEALTGLEPATADSGRELALPVWYHPSVGPDLEPLARQRGLSVDEVIALHSGRAYSVFALGFAPGFGFMGLVDPRLASPRLATPRQRVAAGSVGIAERQTAIYPAVSPGGWNLVGRSPARLFDPSLEGFSLLRPGDRVRFVPVQRDEFVRLGGDETPMEAQA